MTTAKTSLNKDPLNAAARLASETFVKLSSQKTDSDSDTGDSPRVVSTSEYTRELRRISTLKDNSILLPFLDIIIRKLCDLEMNGELTLSETFLSKLNSGKFDSMHISDADANKSMQHQETTSSQLSINRKDDMITEELYIRDFFSDLMVHFQRSREILDQLVVENKEHRVKRESKLVYIDTLCDRIVHDLITLKCNILKMNDSALAQNRSTTNHLTYQLTKDLLDLKNNTAEIRRSIEFHTKILDHDKVFFTQQLNGFYNALTELLTTFGKPTFHTNGNNWFALVKSDTIHYFNELTYRKRLEVLWCINMSFLRKFRELLQLTTLFIKTNALAFLIFVASISLGTYIVRNAVAGAREGLILDKDLEARSSFIVEEILGVSSHDTGSSSITGYFVDLNA